MAKGLFKGLELGEGSVIQAEAGAGDAAFTFAEEGSRISQILLSAMAS